MASATGLDEPVSEAVEKAATRGLGAARMTDSASHPDPVVALVVCLLAPLAMADDAIVAAQRTPPREQMQRKGSLLWESALSCVSAVILANVLSEGLAASNAKQYSFVVRN